MSKGDNENKVVRGIQRQDTLERLEIKDNPKVEIETRNNADYSKELGSGDQGVVYRAEGANGKNVALKVPISGYDEYNKQQLIEYAMKKAMRQLLVDKGDPDYDRINEVHNIERSTKAFRDNNNNKSTVVFTMDLADGTSGSLEEKDKKFYESEKKQIEKLVKRLSNLGFEMGEDIQKDENLFLKDGKLQIGDCGSVRVHKGRTAEKYVLQQVEEVQAKVGIEKLDDVDIYADPPSKDKSF